MEVKVQDKVKNCIHVIKVWIKKSVPNGEREFKILVY